MSDPDLPDAPVHLTHAVAESGPEADARALAKAAQTTVSSLHELPDSPCIGICSTLFDDVCQGCGRTAAEVYNWVFLSDAERLAVWKRITAEGTAVRFVRGPQG